MIAALLFATSMVVGKPAPAWPEVRWAQGGPLTLAGLRGKVALVRFFTDPDCPYCSATAPVLNELHDELGSRGLVVVGFYTPKPGPRATPVGHVRKVARRYGFSFPVAVDDEWKVLRRLWLDHAESGWTSASLLIDRKGIVRHVHPGGAFAKGSPDPESRRAYAEMREAIESLLAEPREALP
ncbi:MAG TPA: redoxin domain-containing protein [Thermoanaerobaculia bacterium]|nr:redoxin domain-containing protein [Thermoanaerobaculia bacterium]